MPISNEEILNKLAALRYYATGLKKPFEKLEKENQEQFVKEAVGILDAIEKLNLMLVARVDPKVAEERRRSLHDRLTSVIKNFNRGIKSFKPDLYPAEELAWQMIKLQEGE